ncbi:putative Late nodulin [Medicago truncatula]|uniref:Nodule Cysteine-Rich (NCR) secreted peptide n=1 Tax=Medicago truncatula TaxID=3880 RepID=A7KHG6_MEDTR|nr:nodule-specific cysteine-rich peptide 336 [Medicago truncatula]AES68602.1 Nodule Cysteine-Rich (NCR) secreted peptide [Medicago truncatula]RHN65477.1 putative Late nodulin [Medicago truncatula]
MAKIVNFVYSMIVFLFLFLVATKAARGYLCVTDSHCPPHMCPPGMEPRCVRRMCKCLPIGWRKYFVP